MKSGKIMGEKIDQPAQDKAESSLTAAEQQETALVETYSLSSELNGRKDTEGKWVLFP